MRTYSNLTCGDVCGSSFWNGIVKTTLIDLINFFTEDYMSTGSADDKVQYDFQEQITVTEEDGTQYKVNFTIYDWKEYRAFDSDEMIEFHIGTNNEQQTEVVVEYLRENGFDAKMWERRW